MSIKSLLTRILQKALMIHAIDLASSYGGYIAFENGLIIQFAMSYPMTVEGTLTQAGTSGVYNARGRITLYYPMRLTNPNVVMVGNTVYSTGHKVPFGFMDLVSSTEARVNVFDFYARPADSNWKCHYLCIGKWK